MTSATSGGISGASRALSAASRSASAMSSVASASTCLTALCGGGNELLFQPGDAQLLRALWRSSGGVE
eukprot:CAMPEP_0170636626 /NCGR_PEP_ID=MMETSP0224-20130122/37924_1 /TAXON_ID=285029 /ORGANISM="Togula jolla, Strain CCCM 725" /LENGTH=67 /DNA_ID=CAMNT_0010966343 /DNA_START=142 /DNA_END=342 /DNA_ORIENTATION=+